MAIYPYQTEPILPLTQHEYQAKMKSAFNKIQASFGQTYPLFIDGEDVYTKTLYTSVNPALKEQVIGIVHQAEIEHAEAAIQSALTAFETWKKVSAKTRADVLFKASALMRKERFLWNAWLVKEAGKPWLEADGDTAEAIDFLEYYGRQMLEIENADQAILSRKNIERNEFRYIPLGVAAVITPWNFPLAILTGMTSACIVTGNTVVLKPAITTQVIARRYVDLMMRAGLPAGVLNFIPGDGPEIGEYLVSHPKIRFVSFTGSKNVGITIYEHAAKVQPTQKWLKRVIAEMGGKDAIVVDEGYDIEAAAEIIVSSAFGFSGQKCSACSRAIIHQAIYDDVIKHILIKTESLVIGNPEDPETFVGPVNDQRAFDKIKDYIQIGKQEGKLLIGGNTDASKGFFIEPTIFSDVDSHARIMQEEIFGPVLAITKANDFLHAIEIANDTEFGLTGAVLSHNRMHLEYARETFDVGNLYLNRKCTGAIVGYQPFGGFHMSGTDSKAGGPDYLLLHMQGKTISEMF